MGLVGACQKTKRKFAKLIFAAALVPRDASSKRADGGQSRSAAPIDKSDHHQPSPSTASNIITDPASMKIKKDAAAALESLCLVV